MPSHEKPVNDLGEWRWAFCVAFHWAAHFDLHRIRKLQISNAEVEVVEGPNYGPFSTPNLPGFSNRLVRS